MAKCALITGASSGIGQELARVHAANGGDLILNARRSDALQALKAELEAAHGITAHVFAGDIGSPGGARALCTDVDQAGLQVDILINNAGFGGIGLHIERPLDVELAMIDLNIKALVTLTHHFGALMAARGGGRILNVGSTAGFLPGPRQAIYFATKAFVNSFSQAIDHELRPRGVTCTVLTPGYVETEFAKHARMENINMVKGGGKSAAQCAAIGYRDMMAGRLVSFNEAKLRFLMNWLVPLMPRRAALKMIEKMQSE